MNIYEAALVFLLILCIFSLVVLFVADFIFQQIIKPPRR